MSYNYILKYILCQKFLSYYFLFVIYWLSHINSKMYYIMYYHYIKLTYVHLLILYIIAMQHMDIFIKKISEIKMNIWIIYKIDYIE
jgi:hypothetical protein